MSGEQKSFGTLLQHGGAEHRLGTGLVSAVEIAATFEGFDENEMPVYARLSNTKNHYEVQELLAQLEGSESALVTASGMAAMSAVCFTLLEPGDHILCQENCYGGNHSFITKVLKKFKIESTFAPLADWEKHFKKNTKLVYFESISNPLCVPQDIEKAVALAKKNGVLSLCDNTFASPINCRPILHGVDVVIESATKYLNGHSDVICGVIAANKEIMKKVWESAKDLGGFLPAAQCAQLLRGLRTLHLRMALHNQNGGEFACSLAGQTDIIDEVYYGPGEKRDEFRRMFSGYAGTCAVRFKKHINVTKLVNEFSYIHNVPSLGGTETTACLPVEMSHRWLAPSERSALGIDEFLVRFSVGLEDVKDIIADVVHVAKKCAKA